jgi:hypothetical protein
MIAILTIGAAAVAGAVVYWLAMRSWYLEWGATDSEVSGAVRGDDQVPQPTYQTTLAIGVHGLPEDVWPWLVQMGNRRGGLYSYDWLDRLFGYLDAPSATTILPAFQQLKPGDVIPLGRGPAFPVASVDPCRSLVLSGKTDDFQWSWQFEIRRQDARHTRLISRNRARGPRGVGPSLFMLALEPAAFLMTRRMLIGIKNRAEKLAAARSQSVRAAAQAEPTERRGAA